MKSNVWGSTCGLRSAQSVTEELKFCASNLVVARFDATNVFASSRLEFDLSRFLIQAQRDVLPTERIALKNTSRRFHE